MVVQDGDLLSDFHHQASPFPCGRGRTYSLHLYGTSGKIAESIISSATRFLTGWRCHVVSPLSPPTTVSTRAASHVVRLMVRLTISPGVSSGLEELC
jgi:hypothetical protein